MSPSPPYMHVKWRLNLISKLYQIQHFFQKKKQNYHKVKYNILYILKAELQRRSYNKFCTAKSEISEIAGGGNSVELRNEQKCKTELNLLSSNGKILVPVSGTGIIQWVPGEMTPCHCRLCIKWPVECWRFRNKTQKSELNTGLKTTLS